MIAPDQARRQDRTLTTTSYAVLSILALRDHSTYDLARQMRLSLHYLWPRAESNVYAEPGRLVDAGLVAARTEWVGRRKRTVYAITEAGRDVLASWLAAPSGRPRYESEALLKVLFAENGDVDALRAAIAAISDDATDVLRHFLAVTAQYAAGEGEYPGRFGLTALASRLLLEQQAATLRWAAWARAAVADWDTSLGPGADWGIEVLRATGRPIDLPEDPVESVVAGTVADRAAPDRIR